MVQREVFMGSAILTFIIVSPEDILAGKIHSFVRGPHIPVEPDHGGHGKTL